MGNDARVFSGTYRVVLPQVELPHLGWRIGAPFAHQPRASKNSSIICSMRSAGCFGFSIYIFAASVSVNTKNHKSFPTRRTSPKPSKQMVALVRRKLRGQLPCIAPTANCMMPRQTPCRAAVQDAGNSHVIIDHHAKVLFPHLALAELSTF